MPDQLHRVLNRVLIMAGGTGGHVFPALAVAQQLRAEGVIVEWLGTSQGLEGKIVPGSGIRLHPISMMGLRGKTLKAKIAACWHFLIAFFQSLLILYHFKPDIVIGMGGFASAPGGVAAWVLRKKLIIHEQNAKLGLSNRLLARFSQRLLEGFPQTFPAHYQYKSKTIGNPLRAEMTAFFKEPHPNNRMHLLVLGGSLGAQALNTIVPQALSLLPQNERPIVCHQTGEKHHAATQALYQKEQVMADIFPFIDDMASRYQKADMVLCRAGALTLAELCAVGRGAILIPYPHAVDDHQTANAKQMVDAGAAILIQEVDLTKEKLASLLQELNQHPEKYQAMAVAAYQLRKTDAVEQMIRCCEEIIN